MSENTACMSFYMESVHELKKAGISVRTNFSLTSLNCQDMKAVYEFSRKEGTLIDIGCYMFPQIRVNGGAYGENQGRVSPEDAGYYQVKAEHLCLSEEDFAKRAKWMLRECKADPGQDKKGYPIQCQAGRSSFWITWDGKMRPCGLMTEPEADVRREGFSAAWKRVHQMAAEIRLPYECRLCANRNLCRVCAGKCVAEKGRFDQKPEYVCRMTSAMRCAYGEWDTGTIPGR